MQNENPVLGVVGGSGGVGATTFAAVLARTAATAAGRSVLVDVDASSGGVDVLLGLESEPGARWSGLRLDGGHLDPDVLLAGLPRAGPCAVLAADAGDPEPAAVEQVVAIAAEAGPVVLDLPRWSCAVRDDAVLSCRLVVLIARGDAAGLVAARTVASCLDGVPLGVLVRKGEVAPDDAAELVRATLLGELPAVGQPWPRLDLDRLPGALVVAARGVLAGVEEARTW